MKPAIIAAIALTLAIYFAPRGKAKQSPTDTTAKVQNQAPSSPAPSRQSDKATDNYQGRSHDAPQWYKSPEWVLVIVGIITALVIGWQSCETRKAAEAAQRTITLQFRPRLAIRGFTIHDWIVAPHVGGEASPRIEFAITNTGASVAHVIEVKIQTYHGDTLIVPTLENPDRISPFDLVPGEVAKRHVFTNGMVTTAFQWLLVRPSVAPQDIRSRVFIAGLLCYSDDAGIVRNTRFFREYNSQTRRFEPTGDTDYEYED